MPYAQVGAVTGLLIALSAAGRLLTLAPPHVPGTDWQLAEAYPGVTPIEVPGEVEGDWAYEPVLFFSATASIGVATPPGGGRTRLMVVDGRQTRTLRQLDKAEAPQFSGFVAIGDQVAWLEQTAGPDRQGAAKLWIAPWRGPGQPRVLTEDIGDFAFFDSEDDLTVIGDRLYWIAAAPGDALRSEMRSVPLAGGPVTKQDYDGAWQLLGGDWLTSAVTTGSTSTALLDWRTGRRSEVRSRPAELVTCGVAWCRVIVLGGQSNAVRIELMRPDGSQRRTAVRGAVTASLVDVALRGNWEVYSRTGHGTSALSAQQVLLYDIAGQRVIQVADGAGQIMGRAGFVWWSSGSGDLVSWRVLDLRALSS